MFTDKELGNYTRFFAIAVAVIGILYIANAGNTQPFVSSEVAFSEKSPSGLEVVPASCALDFEHSNECEGGSPPNAPTVSAVSSSCVLGQPYTISFVATDPDDNQIRYGIDWDGNGITDELVPPSGYVDSGTELEASHTFTEQGTKNISVVAQADNGFTSPWVTYQVFCDDTGSGGTGGTIGGGGAGAPAEITLRAVPSLLRENETTQIHWVASNVESCTVTANLNDDEFTGTASPLEGETSSAILEQTIYTLECIDSDNDTHTTSAIVNIVPTFQEI